MSAVTEFIILILEFFKTGLFAVGGGLATIPFLKQMAERYYDKYGWFSVPELTDMIAVSESTPGPIGVNMATYAGFNMGYGNGEGIISILTGALGGLLATLALITPSIIIIIIVAKFLEKFKGNKYVDGAFYGIRPASSSLVAAAMLEVLILSLFSGAKEVLGFGEIALPFESVTSMSLVGAIFFIVLIPFVVKFKKVHPIVFIAIGAVAGIVFGM